ncbi:MAG: UbiD family decarboxylase domain-containing protein [Phycisphaeraceae bacterium]
MPYSTLQDFIEALDRAGELHRVSAKVSSMLEISAIADRVSKSPAAQVSETAKTFDPHHADLGGKALLFEHVETPEGKAAMPLLINAFGSYRRVEMALGCEAGGLEALAARVAALVKPEPPTGLMEKMKKGLELAKIASFTPKYVKRGRCQEIVKTGNEVNLFDLPVIKCWPHDGDPQAVGYNLTPEQAGTAKGLGRYITFGGVYTIHPDDAGKPDGTPRPSRNVGMYRAQLIDETHTAMHWHMHHDGARHWRAWKEAKKQGGLGEGYYEIFSKAPAGMRGMPCAIVLGGESVLPYSATAPLPPGISELLFAGFLNGGGIELVKCKTIDMHVPANAEIVIEGYVSTEADVIGYDPRHPHAPSLKPHAEAFEGPFGDHTGFYSLPDRYPIFTVTAITHARDPIYPTTIVGQPPQEDYYLGKATERIFLPLLKTIVHDIIDYDLPMFGAFHNCAFIKIKKEYPLQARRVMHAIWGAGQMAWTKMIVVVDHNVNVHDHEEVLFHLCANCDPGRDVEIVNGPLDILDHAAPRLGAGHKIGFDATAKIPGEEVGGHPVRDYPEILSMTDAINTLVNKRWKEYGL